MIVVVQTFNQVFIKSYPLRVLRFGKSHIESKFNKIIEVFLNSIKLLKCCFNLFFLFWMKAHATELIPFKKLISDLMQDPPMVVLQISNSIPRMKIISSEISSFNLVFLRMKYYH